MFSHNLRQLHSMPSFSGEKRWNSEIWVRKTWSYEVNCTFGPKFDCLGLRFSILWAASSLSPCSCTQSFSLWLLFTSVERKHEISYWLRMTHQRGLLIGVCLLSVPPFWQAEWEILRADSLCVGEKNPPVPSKIIFLDSSTRPACHYCIEMPNHDVCKTGRIQSSVMAVVQIFIHGLH